MHLARRIVLRLQTHFSVLSEKLFYSIMFRGKIHERDRPSVKGSIGATLPAIRLTAAVIWWP